MSKPVFFVCALQIFQRAISGERHLGRLKFGLWSLMFSEVGKALSKCIRRDSPINQDDASRFVFGQLSIGANHALVEFIRLFLHSIANFLSIPKTRLSSGPIDVEHEGKIGNAIANGKGIQFFDEPKIELTRRTLANRG
jgi:hypothetical protein